MLRFFSISYLTYKRIKRLVKQRIKVNSVPFSLIHFGCPIHLICATTYSTDGVRSFREPLIKQLVRKRNLLRLSFSQLFTRPTDQPRHAVIQLTYLVDRQYAPIISMSIYNITHIFIIVNPFFPFFDTQPSPNLTGTPGIWLFFYIQDHLSSNP